MRAVPARYRLLPAMIAIVCAWLSPCALADKLRITSLPPGATLQIDGVRPPWARGTNGTSTRQIRGDGFGVRWLSLPIGASPPAPRFSNSISLALGRTVVCQFHLLYLVSRSDSSRPAEKFFVGRPSLAACASNCRRTIPCASIRPIGCQGRPFTKERTSYFSLPNFAVCQLRKAAGRALRIPNSPGAGPRPSHRARTSHDGGLHEELPHAGHSQRRHCRPRRHR